MNDHPPRILPALLVCLALTACAAAGTPPVSLTPSPAPAVAATITPAAPTPTAVPVTPAPLLDPSDLPSPSLGQLPPGALARLGVGILNIVAASPDGRFTAVGLSTGLLVFDAADARLTLSATTSLPVTGVEWSADGKVWVPSRDMAVALWRERALAEEKGR